MFPSLLIQAEKLTPQGAFAQNLAKFLEPDLETVQQIQKQLTEKSIGLVAHYYMDSEIQGVLRHLMYQHIHIADSLQMGNAAIEMAKAGVKSIVVMGVDFMSENIRALLDANGFKHIPLYRLRKEEIGCTLASAAEKKEYLAYLTKASKNKPALHIIYVNTGIYIKGMAQKIIRTITCTSSNVVKLILQAYAQIPDLHIAFGPDTYMGRNLYALLHYYSGLGDVEIKKIHPQHTSETLKSCLKRFDFFKQGRCYVHEMFGETLVNKIKNDYPEALLSAHLEVPGEMFELAHEAVKQNKGVVGSTSDILKFVLTKIENTSDQNKIQFILGTESGLAGGMIGEVQKYLKLKNSKQKLEIIFPVAEEAISQTHHKDHLGFDLMPGASAGDGCSINGSCADCQFMKMNSLDALIDLLEKIGRVDLKAFYPKINQQDDELTRLGTQTILAMQEFQKTGKIIF
jgi:quinolinate synthase